MRYNLAMLRELPVFRPIHYRLEIDGVRHDTAAMLVAIGNGPAYGGGMKVVPGALFDDGLGDVLILHEVSIPEFLRVFPKVFSGAHLAHPSVEIIRGRHIHIEADGIIGYADGERFAALPLHIDIVPGAVTVLG
jgi:diacylglycerol kinase (ATP)